MSQQHLLRLLALCGEHHGTPSDLRQLVTPHLDAMGDEVGFDGVDRGHGSGVVWTSPLWGRKGQAVKLAPWLISGS